jgi:predicted porin
MQKKIIALAVAGLMSGAAFAQSNVQIYGVVDQYYANGSAEGAAGAKDQDFSGLNSGGLSGSRIGFKGTEDLGNGMKAAFVFEYGTLDTTANTNSNSSKTGGTLNTNGMDNWRQAYVGLVGNWGTAVAGRLQHLGYDFAAKYDAQGASIFSSVGQLSDNAAMTTTARGSLGRVDNAVAYISPNLSGFTLKAAYAFGEQIEGTNQYTVDRTAVTNTITVTDTAAVSSPQDIWQLAAEYDNGPLSVGFVYTDVNDFGGTLTGGVSTDQKEWAVGASYDFGMIKPFASYQVSDISVSGAGADTDRTLWNIGARMPIGAAMSVGVTYATLESDTDGAKSLDSDSWGIDLQYALSKRTTVYGGYSKISNDNGLSYTLKNLKGSAQGITAATGSGQDVDQFAVGLRHTF